MSLYLYRGITSEVEVVQSTRLRKGISYTLGQEVQPIQFRVWLTHFMELGQSRWMDVVEKENEHSYPNMVGEFICGGDLEVPELPEYGKVSLIQSGGYFGDIDITYPRELTFVTDDLELRAKLRKRDGQHLRTCAPEVEGSRLVWKMDKCLLWKIDDYLSNCLESVPVSTRTIQTKEKVKYV
jgi:hypothetical protein